MSVAPFSWGPFETPLISPHTTWWRLPASRGSAASRAEPSRGRGGGHSPPLSPPSTAFPPRVSEPATERRARFARRPRCPGRGAGRSRASRRQDRQGPSGAALLSGGRGLSRPAGALVAGSRGAGRPAPAPSTCGPRLPAGAGGGASPAAAPPPAGAARSNSHGNPGSTPFPNPASPPRPSAPARRPPPVGNSLCV